jgi:hypothetical protein
MPFLGGKSPFGLKLARPPPKTGKSRSFPNITKPFPNIAKRLGNIAEAFRSIAKRDFKVKKHFLKIEKLWLSGFKTGWLLKMDTAVKQG